MPLPQETRYTLADALTWDEQDHIELIDGYPVMMAPPTRAKPSTNTACQFPWAMSRQPKASTDTAAAAMNMIPPMVGVPALVACHLGPSSRMACPAFRRRRGKGGLGPSTYIRAQAGDSLIRAASGRGLFPALDRSVPILYRGASARACSYPLCPALPHAGFPGFSSRLRGGGFPRGLGRVFVRVPRCLSARAFPLRKRARRRTQAA